MTAVKSYPSSHVYDLMSEQAIDTRISINELEKNFALKQRLLSLSFEYMLACIAEEDIRILKEDGVVISSLKDFNKSNRLGVSKIIIYPFFLAIINDCSHFLYTLFGEFKTFDYGPGSMDIYKMIRFTNIGYPEFRFFDIDIVKDSSLVKVRDISFDNFEEIRNALLDSELVVNNETATFGEIKIEKDEPNRFKLLHRAITDGITRLKLESNNRFFKFGEKDILSKASHISSFNAAYRANEVKTLRYNDLVKEKDKIFY